MEEFLIVVFLKVVVIGRRLMILTIIEINVLMIAESIILLVIGLMIFIVNLMLQVVGLKDLIFFTIKILV